MEKNIRIVFMISGSSKVEDFEEKGFVPVNRPDLEPYKMTMPFDWNIDPYKDSNWRFQLHTLRYLTVYMGAFKKSKKENYIHKMFEWIEDWYSFCQNNEVEYAWHDMATGIRAEKMYLLARMCDEYSIPKPKFFDNLVDTHLSIMMKDGFFRSNHNHGLYVIHGIRCLAELVEDNDYVLKYCESGWNEILDNQLDENYIHKEHSPHYHFLFVETLERYIKTGFYEKFFKMHTYLKEAKKNCSFLRLPDGREIPFGDTDNALPENNNNKYKLEDSNQLLLSGYFVFRDNNDLTYLALTNNYHSTIHKHWDNLSFIFGYKGQDILMDPGKYKYEQSKLRSLVLSSRCHNTINIDDFDWGRNNLIKDSLKLEAIKKDNGEVHCLSEMSLKVPDNTLLVKRNLKYDGSKLTIEDRVDKDSLYHSRFILNRDAKLISFDKYGVFIFDFNSITVCFKFYNSCGDIMFPTVSNTPVSYEYGSYHESLTINIGFKNYIKTEITIIEK